MIGPKVATCRPCICSTALGSFAGQRFFSVFVTMSDKTDKIKTVEVVAKESKHKHKSKDKEKDKEKDRKKDKEHKRDRRSKHSGHERDDNRSGADGRASPPAPAKQPSKAVSRSHDGVRNQINEEMENPAGGTEKTPLSSPAEAQMPVPAPEAARDERRESATAAPRIQEVKAEITEAGGEVSMSIDETNRCVNMCGGRTIST